MNFQEALRHLDRGIFSHSYFIVGEETFLIETLLENFIKKGLDQRMIGFNYHPFRGEELVPDVVISIANTFPVSGPRRMIVIHNADKIKDDHGSFLGYLSNPMESSTLVFVAEKPDMRKKLFSTLKRQATLITCPRLYDRELSGWIQRAAKKKEVQLSQEAVWFIKEHLGNDLFALQGEIEKISLYLSEEKKEAPPVVSSALVQKVIGGGRCHSIFELTRAVGDKDERMAICLLNRLLEEGSHPLFILTMLTRQWRQMIVAREAIDSGFPEKAISKKVPMPPGLFKRFLQQLKHWQWEELRRAFDLSLSADSQLKGGGLSPVLILETLILDLCLPHHSLPERRHYSLPFRFQDGT